MELEWAEQDGFLYQAVRVWPAGEEPIDDEAVCGSASGAYANALGVTWCR